MTDSEQVAPESSSTRRGFWRPVIGVLALGFAVHVLLPQLSELQQGLHALGSGRWPFLLLSFAGSALSYVAGAWTVRESVDVHPPWGRTTLVQLAAGAASIVTPVGIGWVAVNEGFLQKEGVDEGTARAAMGLDMVLTATSHIGLLLLLLPLLPTIQLPTVSAPQRRVFVDVFVLVSVAAGLALWIPRVRARAASFVRPILDAIPGVVGNPRRSAAMVAGAIGSNLAYAIALYGAVAAFGPAPTPFGVFVVYLVAATVAAIAPTPGGLGAIEAALVAGLTRLAVDGGQAVAATLAFRIATFWLPLVVGSFVLHRVRARDIV